MVFSQLLQVLHIYVDRDKTLELVTNRLIQAFNILVKPLLRLPDVHLNFFEHMVKLGRLGLR